MKYKNILKAKSFKEFYTWLKKNHDKQPYCWICATRGTKPEANRLWYIDAVYAALCFGWIDSVFKKFNGKSYQKFSPRSKKGGHWSELNKERCRWLIKHKYMTKAGLATIPDLSKPFVIDKDVLKILKKDKEVWKNFNSFPKLYQRIRAYNVAFYKFDKKLYKAAVNSLVKNTKANKMYGYWNDNGRLLKK